MDAAKHAIREESHVRVPAIVLGLAAMMLAAFVALAAPAEATGFTQDRTYRVTVENLTENQILTPTVVASHRASLHVFREGREASNGIQQLAENGGVPVLVEELAANRKVSDVIAVGNGQPIDPGASTTAYLTAARNATRVSVAGMLICTNDGFGGVNSAGLPRWVGHAKTFYGNAYDAGTEVNTESYADLAPPCDGKGQTGDSNPKLAENGVVHGHEGIMGGASLSEEQHGWTDPVFEVTVSRIG